MGRTNFSKRYLRSYASFTALALAATAIPALGFASESGWKPAQENISANPYVARREALRAQNRQQAMDKVLQPMALGLSLKQPVAYKTTAEENGPLKLVIPNLNATRQQRHPAAIVMARPLADDSLFAYNNAPVQQAGISVAPSMQASAAGSIGTGSSSSSGSGAFTAMLPSPLKQSASVSPPELIQADASSPPNPPETSAKASTPLPKKATIVIDRETVPTQLASRQQTPEPALPAPPTRLAEDGALEKPRAPALAIAGGAQATQETLLASADAKPQPKVIYRSPDIIVRKEVYTTPRPPEWESKSLLSPQEMAELMPAAGPADTTPTMPLIQLPEENKTAAAPVPTPPVPPPAALEAVATPTATVAPIAPTPPETAANNLPSLKPLLEKGTPAAPAPTPVTPAVDVSASASPSVAPAEPPQPLPASEPSANPLATIVPTPSQPPLDPKANSVPEALPPIEPLVSATPEKPAKKISAVKKEPAITPLPVDSGEPSQQLSQESKAILNKLSPDLDKRKKASTGHLDIERAKDTRYLMNTDNAPSPDVESTKREAEAMGIKIEVRNRKTNWDYELDKAYNAMISGHSDEAIRLYKMVLSNDPNNKNGLFGLATIYHRSGQLDMARPLYGKLLSIDPENRDALNNFLVLLADEAPEEALNQLERLEAKNPTFSPIPAQMAVIYQKLGNTEKASDKMFRAVALAPENMTYRYNLAIMLDKQHNYEEAAKLYRQLVEAQQRGEVIPGNVQKIQERLTFIGSNRH